MPNKGWVTLPRVFFALLVLYAILEWGFNANILAVLLFVALIVIGAILSARLIRLSIWRLRNRLYVTYLFIGVVPIVLILVLAAIGTWIITGQVAVYLVSSELERRAASLATPARVLSQTKPEDRITAAQQMGRFLAERMPGVLVLVSGDKTVRYPPESTLEMPPVTLDDYNGFLLKDGAYYSAAIVKSGNTTALAIAPTDPEVLKNLVPGIGVSRFGLKGKFAGVVPAPASGWERLDFEVTWANQIRVADWADPQTSRTAALFVTTRPSAVLNIVFGNGIDTAQNATFFFALVLGLLLLGELISLVIGISLTRTITRAVHGLYEGTSRIGKGDFAWRIPVKGNDQLAELGHSFNNMTAQIENLVVIAKEKKDCSPRSK